MTAEPNCPKVLCSHNTVQRLKSSLALWARAMAKQINLAKSLLKNVRILEKNVP